MNQISTSGWLKLNSQYVLVFTQYSLTGSMIPPVVLLSSTPKGLSEYQAITNHHFIVTCQSIFTLIQGRYLTHCEDNTEVCATLIHSMAMYVATSGFGGLQVACWPLVPKFTGSHPAEAVEFLGRKNPQHAFLQRESKAVGPMSQICGT